MRAGLARACAAALQANSGEAQSCSSACQRVIARHVVEGQPPGLPCPHRDCGVLAVTVSIVDGPLGTEKEGLLLGHPSSADQPAEACSKGEENKGPPAAEGCRHGGGQYVDVELGVVHNSRSMAFAYWSHGMHAPHCTILRQPQVPSGAGEKPGARMCCEGARKRWRLPVAT